MPLRMLSILVSALTFSAVCATAARAEAVRVALLPVVVHTSESDSAYVSDGLGDMLSARIERSGEVAVQRVSARPTTNGQEANLTAREAGADYVLYGSFTQFGAGASLDIRCAPVSTTAPAAEGATRHIFIQTGTLQEIIPELDDLSDKIIRYLVSGAERGEAGPTAGATGTEAVSGDDAPTDSLAELRARIEALERAVYSGTSELDSGDGPSLAEAR